jgi:hypothetical protein
VGSWSTFPAVDFETDAFLQETPEDAQVLSNRVKNVGNHLGYDAYFGIWAYRKLGAALVHEGVGAATSSMWLGHAGTAGVECTSVHARCPRTRCGHVAGALVYIQGRAAAVVLSEEFIGGALSFLGPPLSSQSAYLPPSPSQLLCIIPRTDSYTSCSAHPFRRGQARAFAGAADLTRQHVRKRGGESILSYLILSLIDKIR